MKLKKPYKTTQVASPNVAKYKSSIRPNLFINLGTKGQVQKLEKANILIKKPKISSFTPCFVAIPGNNGAIIE